MGLMLTSGIDRLFDRVEVLANRGTDNLNCFAKSLMVTCSTKCSRLISGMTSIFITPGFSGKKPIIEQPGVETFQRSFPQDPGKFCTPFCNHAGFFKEGYCRF
jgi:hypothetical protein